MFAVLFLQVWIYSFYVDGFLGSQITCSFVQWLEIVVDSKSAEEVMEGLLNVGQFEFAQCGCDVGLLELEGLRRLFLLLLSLSFRCCSCSTRNALR